VGGCSLLPSISLEQQVIMPGAIEPRHAEGGGADPEQAAVGDGVHCRGDIPRVSYA